MVRSSLVEIHRTHNGTGVFVEPGRKSRYDFVVRYREAGKRVRTPKHIHLIIDLYMKKMGNQVVTMVTMELVDHIIEVINALRPARRYPPELEFFSPGILQRFSLLDRFGEYPTEFLLVVSELIMLQEVTNYPGGTFNLNLFEKFRAGADVFSVVSAATLGQRRGI